MPLPGPDLGLSAEISKVAAVPLAAAGGGALLTAAAVVIRLKGALTAVASDVAAEAGALDGLLLAFEALATLFE